MDTNTTHHKLRVFIHGGRGRVEPGHLVVKPNDTFEFVTINTDASFFFPKPGVVVPATEGANNRFGDLRLDHAKKGERVVFTVISTTKGVYPYAVFCTETNDFAEGHSSPMMIIEDFGP